MMKDGLKLKFQQNPQMLEKLLSTGNRMIVEFSEKDRYWGDGGDGTGKNRLGVILVELR